MEKLNNSKHCEVADNQVEYFTQIEKHEKALNEKLKEKFGEYASVSYDTIADEDGGEMVLSFGRYDVRDELMNFACDVAKSMEISLKSIQEQMQYYIENCDLNVDVEWQESPKLSSTILFFNGDNYRDMTIENEADEYRFEILNELHKAIEKFVDVTMTDAVQYFANCYVMEYSSYNNEL